MGLEALTRFFMWCTIVNGALLLLWTTLLIFAPELVYLDYRGLVLFHRPVFKSRQNIVDFCTAFDRHMVIMIQNLRGLTGTWKLRYEYPLQRYTAEFPGCRFGLTYAGLCEMYVLLGITITQAELVVVRMPVTKRINFHGGSSSILKKITDFLFPPGGAPAPVGHSSPLEINPALAIGFGAVEAPQDAVLGPRVVVDHIENDRQTGPVGIVHKIPQILGAAVCRFGGEKGTGVVAPGAVRRKFVNREQFDGIKSECADAPCVKKDVAFIRLLYLCKGVVT